MVNKTGRLSIPHGRKQQMMQELMIRYIAVK